MSYNGSVHQVGFELSFDPETGESIMKSDWPKGEKSPMSLAKVLKKKKFFVTGDFNEIRQLLRDNFKQVFTCERDEPTSIESIVKMIDDAKLQKLKKSGHFDYAACKVIIQNKVVNNVGTYRHVGNGIVEFDPQMIRVFPIKAKDWNPRKNHRVFSISEIISAIHELRGEGLGKEVGVI